MLRITLFCAAMMLVGCGGHSVVGEQDGGGPDGGPEEITGQLGTGPFGTTGGNAFTFTFAGETGLAQRFVNVNHVHLFDYSTVTLTAAQLQVYPLDGGETFSGVQGATLVFEPDGTQLAHLDVPVDGGIANFVMDAQPNLQKYGLDGGISYSLTGTSPAMYNLILTLHGQ